jgi:hypothetical protein
MIVSHILHADAGSPGIAKPAVDCNCNCAFCGAPTTQGVRVKDAFGPGFTDWDKLAHPGSGHVCVPCVWLLGGQPPQTLRLWSVLYREDWHAPPGNPKAAYAVGPRTWLTSKGDLSHVIDTLLDPPECPWVCSLADSGQIHTVPFAQVNHGSAGWVVRYEREDIASHPREFAEVLWHAVSLLSAGFIRDDLATLDPHPAKLVKHGIDVWRQHAEPLKPYRRSPLLALAITMCKRDEYDNVRGRAGRAREELDARADEQRNDRENQPHQLVAPSEVGLAGGGSAGQDVGRDGGHDVPQAGNPGAAQRHGQLSLWDDA